MCGILSIVNTTSGVRSEDLIAASSIIRHRGPDDEGLLTWNPGENPVIWAGGDTAPSTLQHWRYQPLQAGKRFSVGFGHRRLSILDLSPGGHQPMQFSDAGLTITYNGEVYNYPDVRKELEALGHTFNNRSDTEVILHAWAQWGPECLHRFNGMFAFVILDHKRNELFAVRDRFGVKPLYYYMHGETLYLASEIKQIKTAPGYSLNLNEKAIYHYLANSAVDHTDATFDTRIKHLPQGHYLHLKLADPANSYQIKQWYELKPRKWQGSYEEAAVRLRELLTDAVNVRLRSDVPVGSCLSGGLDSSTIVCLAAELLKQRGETAGQETVTACYDIAQYDEWQHAAEVIKKTNARPHRTFPKFIDLQNELNEFIWHQDEPVTSTSMFSQWCVFKATNKAGLKVMIDGQGADEQLAGYGGNDLAFYAGLLQKRQYGALWDEARHYKQEKGHWPKGFLLNAMKLNAGKQLPVYTVDWLTPAQPASLFPQPAHSLQQNLLRQIYGEPLPALLRYEDRNSMAWSIESRTPFMDYRILEFTLGLPERFVYKNGTRKAILRTAMTGVLPDSITNRRDKMGFVTPEEMWLKGEGKDWFMNGIDKVCSQFGGTILNVAATRQYVTGMIEGKIPFNFVPWRLLCLGQWYEGAK
jgi:asparagine synthase (glutamine-hydrolysing)